MVFFFKEGGRGGLVGICLQGYLSHGIIIPWVRAGNILQDYYRVVELFQDIYIF